MKIAFIPTNVSGVNFYRIWQPAMALKTVGVETAVLWYQHNHFEMHPWENDLIGPHSGRIGKDSVMACMWADAVVWMGLHTPIALDLFKRVRMMFPEKVFLTEMDDFIFSIPKSNIASSVFTPGNDLFKVFIDQVKLSDGVIVSTPYLKSLYDDLNECVHVVENAIDLSLWRRREPSPRRQRVTIGWMGGGTHNDDLEMVKDAVFKILDEFPNVRMKILHGASPSYRKHKKVKWDKGFRPINQYPSWVSRAKFDIGIAPLVDNNFNRGKSNLRWLEYSAMGIPTVASRLPHFVASIADKQTGLLAKDNQEFYTHLKFLVESPSMRRTMGDLAKKAVGTMWSPKVMAVKYRGILKEIINAKSNTRYARDLDRRSDRRSQQHALVG